MAEPTLQEVFGSNATQDNYYLTINKTDLEAVGLTSTAENTSESLMAAILLQAANYLNEINQESDPDIQLTISRQDDSITFRNDKTYRQYSFIINLQKEELETAIDPDLF